MQIENLEGQESIFGRDSGSGKMSSVLSQVGGTLKRVKKSLGRIFKKSSKRSSKLKNHTFMLLDLRPGALHADLLLGPHHDGHAVAPHHGNADAGAAALQLRQVHDLPALVLHLHLLGGIALKGLAADLGRWPPRCWAVPLKISATAPPTAGGCRIGCWAAMRPGRTASPAS